MGRIRLGTNGARLGTDEASMLVKFSPAEDQVRFGLVQLMFVTHLHLFVSEAPRHKFLHSTPLFYPSSVLQNLVLALPPVVKVCATNC